MHLYPKQNVRLDISFISWIIYTGCPIQGVFLTQCSCGDLQIHMNPDQNKAVIQDFILLILRDNWKLNPYTMHIHETSLKLLDSVNMLFVNTPNLTHTLPYSSCKLVLHGLCLHITVKLFCYFSIRKEKKENLYNFGWLLHEVVLIQRINYNSLAVLGCKPTLLV